MNINIDNENSDVNATAEVVRRKNESEGVEIDNRKSTKRTMKRLWKHTAREYVVSPKTLMLSKKVFESIAQSPKRR